MSKQKNNRTSNQQSKQSDVQIDATTNKDNKPNKKSATNNEWA